MLDFNQMNKNVEILVLKIITLNKSTFIYKFQERQTLAWGGGGEMNRISAISMKFC